MFLSSWLIDKRGPKISREALSALYRTPSIGKVYHSMTEARQMTAVITEF